MPPSLVAGAGGLLGKAVCARLGAAARPARVRWGTPGRMPSFETLHAGSWRSGPVSDPGRCCGARGPGCMAAARNSSTSRSRPLPGSCACCRGNSPVRSRFSWLPRPAGLFRWRPALHRAPPAEPDLPLRTHETGDRGTRERVRRPQWSAHSDRPDRESVRSRPGSVETAGTHLAAVLGAGARQAHIDLRLARHDPQLSLRQRLAEMVVGSLALARAHTGTATTKILTSARGVTVGAILGECRRVFGRPVRVVLGTSPLAKFQSSNLSLRSVTWPELDALARTTLPAGIAATYRDMWVRTNPLGAERTRGLRPSRRTTGYRRAIDADGLRRSGRPHPELERIADVHYRLVAPEQRATDIRLVSCMSHHDGEVEARLAVSGGDHDALQQPRLRRVPTSTLVSADADSVTETL